MKSLHINLLLFLSVALSAPLFADYAGHWRVPLYSTGFVTIPKIESAETHIANIHFDTQTPETTKDLILQQASAYSTELATAVGDSELVSVLISLRSSNSMTSQQYTYSGYGLHHAPSGRFWAPMPVVGNWGGLPPARDAAPAQQAVAREFARGGEWPPLSQLPILVGDAGNGNCSADLMANISEIDDNSVIDGILFSFNCLRNITFSASTPVSAPTIGADVGAYIPGSLVERFVLWNPLYFLIPSFLAILVLVFPAFLHERSYASPLSTLCIVLWFTTCVNIASYATELVPTLFNLHNNTLPASNVDSLLRVPRLARVGAVLAGMLMFIVLCAGTMMITLQGMIGQETMLLRASELTPKAQKVMRIVRSSALNWTFGVILLCLVVAMDSLVPAFSYYFVLSTFVIALIVQILADLCTFKLKTWFSFFEVLFASSLVALMYLPPTPSAPSSISGFSNFIVALSFVIVGFVFALISLVVKIAGQYSAGFALAAARRRLRGRVPDALFDKLVGAGDGRVEDGERVVVCPICMDDVLIDRADGNHALTPCDHVMHLSCLKEWVDHRANAGCPVCRGYIPAGGV